MYDYIFAPIVVLTLGYAIGSTIAFLMGRLYLLQAHRRIESGLYLASWTLAVHCATASVFGDGSKALYLLASFLILITCTKLMGVWVNNLPTKDLFKRIGRES